MPVIFSRRYLLAKGRDAEAIAVVHHIAAFNKAPAPQLTLDDFQALDAAERELTSGSTAQEHLLDGAQHQNVGKRIMVCRIRPPPSRNRPRELTPSLDVPFFFPQFELKRLKGLFRTKRAIWLFASMAVVYVRPVSALFRPTLSELLLNLPTPSFLFADVALLVVLDCRRFPSAHPA